MSRRAEPRRALAALAVALLFGAGFTLALPARASADDSPPPTVDTTPVSTVTDVAPPTTTPTFIPKPDAAPSPPPSRRAKHPVSLAHTQSAPARVPAPATPTRAPVRPLLRPALPRPTTRKPSPQPHPATRAHAPAKRRPRPAVHTTTSPAVVEPAPVVFAKPAAASTHRGVWLLAAAIGLLVAIALVATARELRRPSAARRRTPSADGTSSGEELCTVECWRGYLRSQFIACTRTSSDPASVIAESRFFNWRRRSPPPERPDVTAALAELLEDLGGLGWEPDGRGAFWFEQRFRRTAAETEISQPEAPPSRRLRRRRRAPVAAARDARPGDAVT